jgi:hypothetical protein
LNKPRRIRNQFCRQSGGHLGTATIDPVLDGAVGGRKEQAGRFALAGVGTECGDQVATNLRPVGTIALQAETPLVRVTARHM